MAIVGRATECTCVCAKFRGEPKIASPRNFVRVRVFQKIHSKAKKTVASLLKYIYSAISVNYYVHGSVGFILFANGYS